MTNEPIQAGGPNDGITKLIDLVTELAGGAYRTRLDAADKAGDPKAAMQAITELLAKVGLPAPRPDVLQGLVSTLPDAQHYQQLLDDLKALQGGKLNQTIVGNVMKLGGWPNFGTTCTDKLG